MAETEDMRLSETDPASQIERDIDRRPIATPVKPEKLEGELDRELHDSIFLHSAPKRDMFAPLRIQDLFAKLRGLGEM